MLNKNVIEEGLAQCIKDIAGCQTHLANYDYTGIKLKYPRIVVDVQMPQFFARQSRSTDLEPARGRVKSRVQVPRKKVIAFTEAQLRTIQQFELDVVITCIGSPQDNLAYEKLQQIRGKIHEDYDLLFPQYDIKGLFVNAFSEIEDISVELKTKVEDRYRMTMTLTGSTEIYNDSVTRILEVNPQISYEK